MEIFLTILTQTIEICSKRTKKFANVCEIYFVKSGIDIEIDETKFFLSTQFLLATQFSREGFQNFIDNQYLKYAQEVRPTWGSNPRP